MNYIQEFFRQYAVFIRYIISGISSVITQFGILAFMVEIFHIDPVVSSGTGFIFGCIVNYLMLYYWTFNTHGKHFGAIIKYTIVTLSALVLNLLFFSFLINTLMIWYLLAQAIATGTLSLLTYVVNKYYTFAEK